MVQQHNRIAQQADKFGGQPYVEGTIITVQTIIELALNGKSQMDIQKLHPQLELEDIYQALSFGIGDFLRGVSYWRHDAMTPLTQIKGYSEILVGRTEFDELDTIPREQQEKWLSIIHSSSQRSIARWQQMSHWINNQYYVDIENNLEVYTIDWLIHSIVSISQNYEPTLDIEIQASASPFNITTHEETATILASVLSYAKNTFQSKIRIQYSTHQQDATIQIKRMLQYHDDDITKLLTTHYNPIGTARKFFFAHQHPFVVEQNNAIVTFTLQLPVWTDPEKT
jgi:uncharacterized protein (DUF433 family)